MSKSYIYIHCDGSSLGNPGASGYGAVLQYKGHTKKIHGPLGTRTNNEAELLAVIKALQAITKPDQLITIYSDSQYVVNGISYKWKIKTNLGLWKELRAEIKKHRQVISNWIPRQMMGEADTLSKIGSRENET